MLWDPSFDSWRHFGVQANSDMRVVDANGATLGDNIYLMTAENAETILSRIGAQ